MWVLVCGLRFCGLWLFFHVLFVTYGLLFADLLFGGHGLWFKAWCCCRRSSFSFAKEKTKLSCDCVAITRRCAAARATWGGGRGWGGLKETVGCRVCCQGDLWSCSKHGLQTGGNAGDSTGAHMAAEARATCHVHNTRWGVHNRNTQQLNTC